MFRLLLALLSAKALATAGLFALPFLTPRVQGQPGSQPDMWSSRPTVRAVVIGISDYQNVGIPDLQFANRDAEAFADWLKSPAGGSVPEENIVLLTNQKATNARIAASLDWLIEVSGEDDQIVIYFSGHGDVETRTRGQFGFLLAWDSPPTNYKAGAYSIIYLQDIISTLSIDKKCKVTIVTDACHAGKLAGSSIGGTQATAQALAQQFANEVKIMSCQPNEFSLEGKQWGGGRGVFSFHLLNGLTGLADQNSDGANGYSYPSASLSYVFSENLKIPKMSFGKLRLGWGKTGNDTDPYNLYTTYVPNPNFGSLANFTVSNTLNKIDLKPENTISVEAGADLRFFRERLGLDVSVYQQKTTDQIIPLSTSAASGFERQFINAGEITNRGIEIALRAVPLRAGRFS